MDKVVFTILDVGLGHCRARWWEKPTFLSGKSENILTRLFEENQKIDLPVITNDWKLWIGIQNVYMAGVVKYSWWMIFD